MTANRFSTAAATASILLAGLVLGMGAHAQTPEVDWPPMLRIGTPGTVTGSFASTNGWAPLLESSIGATVRVIPVDSEANRYLRLAKQNQLELASISLGEAAYQVQGQDAYAAMPPKPLRIVWHHNDTPWALFVRGDSEYESVYDLKQAGVRVSVGSQSPAMTRVAKKALPGFLGMTPEEAEQKWEFVPAGSYGESCRAVTDGKADVAWCSPISAVITEMEGHPKGIRALDQPMSDKQAWKRWLDVRPTHIPSEITIGASSARGAEGLVSNFVYWTRPDMGEDMVYSLAKWFDSQYDEYKDTHFLASRMSVEQFRTFLDRNPMPVHAGTVRYLREIGAWTEEDDQWNQAAIKKMDRWLAARKDAMDEARDKGVTPHWENEEFLNIVAKHTGDLSIFKTRGFN